MPSKPYLTLRDRLSQIWINKQTIFIILIALKLILFHKSLQESLNTTKEYTLDSCPAIDSFASTASSIPHYLSKSANYMIVKSMEEMNEMTKDGLKLILTGSENIIIFALEMVIGTYACVLVAAVDGAVDVAVNSTESIISWVNDTLGEVTDDIEDGLTDLSKFINKVVDAAEDVKDFFTGEDEEDEGNSTISKVNLTVSSLRNLHIPSSVNSKLEKLKENTPDFDTVKNKTEALIKSPFELVKKKISNSTLINADDADTLYAPELTTSTICSDNSDTIIKFYENIGKDVTLALKVLVVLLILAALLALLPLAFEEYRKWTRLQELKTQYEEKVMSPIDSYERIFNRYPTSFGLTISSKIASTPENQTTVRWFSAYVFSARSLVVLGIGLTGILAVILQVILLKVLSTSISHNKSSFSAITDELTNQVAESISNWTDSTNVYIEDKETEVNEDLFSWVKTATDSINDTVSAFVDEMNELLADAFNGTLLYAPVKTVVGCVIESKLIKIEEGLTWIHDHAEVTFPRVNESYITEGLGNNSGDGETSLVSKASELVQDTENMMAKLLKLTIAQYKKSVMFELYVSLTILGLWVLQIVIAFLICWYDGTLDVNEGIKNAEIDGTRRGINDKWDISYPRELTIQEKEELGYPYSAPLATAEKLRSRDLTGTFNNDKNVNDPFRDSKALEDIFSDGHAIENDSHDNSAYWRKEGAFDYE